MESAGLIFFLPNLHFPNYYNNSFVIFACLTFAERYHCRVSPLFGILIWLELHGLLCCQEFTPKTITNVSYYNEIICSTKSLRWACTELDVPVVKLIKICFFILLRLPFDIWITYLFMRTVFKFMKKIQSEIKNEIV